MFWDVIFWLGVWQLTWWVMRVLDLIRKNFFGIPISTER